MSGHVVAQVAVWEGVSRPLLSAALARGTNDLQERFRHLVSDTTAYTSRAAQNFGLSGEIAPAVRYAIMRCVAQMFADHHQSTGGYMDRSLAETVMETVTTLRDTAFPEGEAIFPEDDLTEITRRRIATATAIMPIVAAFARYPIPGEGLADDAVRRIRDRSASMSSMVPNAGEDRERIQEAILAGLAEVWRAAHDSVASGRSDVAVYDDIVARFEAQADILGRFSLAVAHQPTIATLPTPKRR